MASTIENINNNIIKKIDIIKNIIDEFYDKKIDPSDISILIDCKKEIIDLLDEYEIGSIEYINRHFNKDKQAYRDYINYITIENIRGKIERIFNVCKRLHKKYKNINISDLIDIYETIIVDIIPVEKNNNICICGSIYELESKTSEYLCKKCGYTEKIYGVVFEDEQFFFQEGQRTKHGKYDPTKHCKIWIDRIQAKETDIIPDNIINYRINNSKKITNNKKKDKKKMLGKC